MGLFSSKKVVVVDSVVYNLAGDEKDRPDYLKSLVVRNVLSRENVSLGESLSKGYLNGPAMKFRSFFRWAQRPGNYNLVGIPTGQISYIQSVNNSTIANYIPHAPDEEVVIQSAEAGNSNLTYWAERFILEHYPDDMATEWGIDYNSVTNQLTIRFVDSSSVIINVPDYVPSARYIYAYYNTFTSPYDDPLVTGPTILVGSGSFPSTTGWVLESDTVVLESVDIEPRPEPDDPEEEESPGEGGDPEEDPVDEEEEPVEPEPDPEPITVYYEKGTRVYTRTVFVGNFNDQLRYREETMYFTYDAHVEDYELVSDNAYRVDYVMSYSEANSPMRLFIYRVGSGIPALDALVSSAGSFGEFYPFIPFRIENEFLTDPGGDPDLQEQLKKAYKKATGSSLSKIVESVADNESLEDIDHAYVVFGVSLNVVEPDCRKYIYSFMETLANSQIGGLSAYTDYKNFLVAEEPLIMPYLNYRKSKNRGGSSGGGSVPPEPSFKLPPNNEIQISGSGPVNSRYDVRISWGFIEQHSATGQGRSGAKAGDCWFTVTNDIRVPAGIYSYRSGPEGETDYALRQVNIPTIRMYWQRSANSYTYLDIVNLNYTNYIYQDKAVEISAKEALESAEESGFIIPLHHQSFIQTGMIPSSQMATACCFVVFNCYEIHKVRWYQRGIFKVLFVIVLAVVSVLFTGGAGFGLLGSSLSIGTSLGFSGMTAAIVGSVANALAALVLTTLIEEVAGDLGVLGQIIGVLVGFVVGSISSSIQTGGLATFNWGDLLKADNLLKLTNAVGRGVANSINAETAGYQQKMEDLQSKAEAELKKINEAYYSEFGYGGGGLINPFMFVDSDDSFQAESSSTFLARTLLTGSEVVQMSQDLLYDFAKYSLKLPDAFT